MRCRCLQKGFVWHWVMNGSPVKKGVHDSGFFFNFTFFCQNQSPSKMELLLWYHRSLKYSHFVDLKDCLRTRELLFSFSIPHYAGDNFLGCWIPKWYYSKKKKNIAKMNICWCVKSSKVSSVSHYQFSNKQYYFYRYLMYQFFFWHLRKNNPFLILIFIFRNIDCFARSLLMTVAASNC